MGASAVFLRKSMMVIATINICSIFQITNATLMSLPNASGAAVVPSNSTRVQSSTITLTRDIAFSACGREEKEEEMMMMMLVLRDLAPRVVAQEVVLPLLLPLLVPLLVTGVGVVVVALLAVALVGCKARARACSSAQSRPSTPPLWSKVRILFTTLLTLTPMVYGACDATKCTPTPCNLTDRHLIVPNTVTAIAECKLVVV
jgi:hypothetical protein